jgi:hypothetical protein
VLQVGLESIDMCPVSFAHNLFALFLFFSHALHGQTRDAGLCGSRARIFARFAEARRRSVGQYRLCVRFCDFWSLSSQPCFHAPPTVCSIRRAIHVLEFSRSFLHKTRNFCLCLYLCVSPLNFTLLSRNHTHSLIHPPTHLARTHLTHPRQLQVGRHLRRPQVDRQQVCAGGGGHVHVLAVGATEHDCVRLGGWQGARVCVRACVSVW